MNAITANAPRTAPHATHTFKLLLRREFWEHKGGFVWAPVGAGAITLLITLMAVIAGTVMGRKHGNEFSVGDTPQKIAEVLGGLGDASFLSGFGITMFVMGIVVFFYAIGSLYDDRKDRSVLFWKSMPVSDAATVGAKVAWALLLAPLVAVAVGVLIGLGLWVIAIFTTTVNGISGASGILTHSHPLQLTFNVIALIPLYALWALPAVGWLMLCSAAARSKPFLWAVMIPVIGCALVSMAGVMGNFGLDTGKLWYTVAYRGLLSVFPGSWMPTLPQPTGEVNGPEDLPRLLEMSRSMELLGSADLWVGAVLGVVMILAAIRLRRWRDEG